MSDDIHKIIIVLILVLFCTSSYSWSRFLKMAAHSDNIVSSLIYL